MITKKIFVRSVISNCSKGLRLGSSITLLQDSKYINIFASMVNTIISIMKTTNKIPKEDRSIKNSSVNLTNPAKYWICLYLLYANQQEIKNRITKTNDAIR